MWIRIGNFTINLDNVTNINEEKDFVYISFNHGVTQLGSEGNPENVYWNSLAFKREDIPKQVWGIFHGLIVYPRKQ